MGRMRVGRAAWALLSAAMVAAVAVMVRASRTRWTDHDVSDPGVTL